jgi:two-component system NtrC family sensor kinase
MSQSGGVEKKTLQMEQERKRIAVNLAGSMRLTAIGQLTAGVAHELNNPLSVILGFTQSLIQHPNDQETLMNSLKTIERETQRCRRVVQDLLNFSRVPRSGKVLENIVQVLEGAMSLIEIQTRIQNVELVRNFSNDLPPIYLDRHRIQQMIINLCINSLDAMPKGGKLTIRVALVPDIKGAGVLEIQVADSGTGIPRNIKEHIFKPFFTTKEPGKGTGLGLSLVRDIVKDHDGRLEFCSEDNQGTTFTIRLPVRSNKAMSRRRGKNVEEPSVLSIGRDV